MAEGQSTELKTSMAEVAQQLYGDKFTGEVPAKKPVAEPAEEPAEEAAAEEPAEEPVEIEEEAPESVEEEVPEPVEATEETEEPSGEVDISTLSELVEHYDLDSDWAKGLKVPVKVNGSESTASIEDLVASYQMGEAAEIQLDAAKAERHKGSDEVATRLQEVNNQAGIAAGLIERARKELDTDVSGINWDKLRQDDPAEYSAKKADVVDRQQRIESLEGDALAEYQKVIGEQNEQAAQNHTNMLRAGQAKLLEKLPEWADPETEAAEKGKITKYLTLPEQGFSANDIAKASDHRIILLARKAMLYDEGRGKANVAKKKVAKIPKIMKPGSPKPEDQRKTENIDRLAARAKKTGKLADGLALLKAKRRA